MPNNNFYETMISLLNEKRMQLENEITSLYERFNQIDKSRIANFGTQWKLAIELSVADVNKPVKLL